MKRRAQLFLMIALCIAGASGCRRKPIETESQAPTEAETQSEPQTETGKATEPLTEKITEKESETQKKTTTPTRVTANKTQKNTAAGAATQACPYCGNSFSTTAAADGSSEYSAHVAQEEAYIRSIGKDPATYLSSGSAGTGTQSSSDSSGYQTGSDGTLYAQCPYCFQWFSDAADASGYSPYAEHIAAEAAYANQQSNEDYVQCPNCGNWVTQDEYQEHINNGW